MIVRFPFDYFEHLFRLPRTRDHDVQQTKSVSIGIRVHCFNCFRRTIIIRDLVFVHHFLFDIAPPVHLQHTTSICIAECTEQQGSAKAEYEALKTAVRKRTEVEDAEVCINLFNRARDLADVDLVLARRDVTTRAAAAAATKLSGVLRNDNNQYVVLVKDHDDNDDDYEDTKMMSSSKHEDKGLVLQEGHENGHDGS